LHGWRLPFFFLSCDRKHELRVSGFTDFDNSLPAERVDSVRFAGMSVVVNLHARKLQSPECDKGKKRSTPHVVNQAFGLRILHHFRNFDFTYSFSMVQGAGNSKDLSR
jgi:hypothetical protein